MGRFGVGAVEEDLDPGAGDLDEAGLHAGFAASGVEAGREVGEGGVEPVDGGLVGLGQDFAGGGPRRRGVAAGA